MPLFRFEDLFHAVTEYITCLDELRARLMLSSNMKNVDNETSWHVLDALSANVATVGSLLIRQ